MSSSKPAPSASDNFSGSLAGAMERREFLKAGGALVIGFSMRGVMADVLAAQGAPAAAGIAARGTAAGPPDPKQIDTWLAIHADNTATVYIGYVELGQGSTTSLLQISAEELDLDMSQVSTVRLDTNVTPNQGGTYSSSSIARGSPAIRTAAAEARLALLGLASKKLDAPVESLTVSKGVVSTRMSAKSVTYGELIGDKQFNLAFTGKATPKPVTEYKLVGARPVRNDIPDKVSGKYVYIQHLRLPGMVHGRVVRPRGQAAYGAGAKVASLEESSIAQYPRRARAPQRRFRRRGGGHGMGRGARRARPENHVGHSGDAAGQRRRLRGDARGENRRPRGARARRRGRRDRRRAARRRAELSWAVSGARAVRPELRARGRESRFGAGDLLDAGRLRARATRWPESSGCRPRKVRVQYYEGSGTYGHSCYDDVAQAAAILSQLAGKPVRLQFMRWDEHGWDLYGPAHVGEVRAAADADGKLVALRISRLAPPLERRRNVRAARAGHAGFGMARTARRRW